MKTTNGIVTFIDNPFIVTEVMSDVDDVVICSPDDRLLGSLSQVTSSHEPVFVMQDGHFLGLIALHQLLYKNRVPPSTRVRNALFKPPHFTLQSSLFAIVTTMVSTRVYIMPVFDGESDRLLGVVQAAAIFHHFLKTQANIQLLADALSIRDPVSASADQSVMAIYHLFRKNGVARIVLTDDLGHLSGIISRGDVQKILFVDQTKQRYLSHGGNAQVRTLKLINKPNHEDRAIKFYMNRNVFHLPSKWSKTKILAELISAPYNSVILTDENEKPVGIVSNRDILETVASFKPVI